MGVLNFWGIQRITFYSALLHPFWGCMVSLHRHCTLWMMTSRIFSIKFLLWIYFHFRVNYLFNYDTEMYEFEKFHLVESSPPSSMLMLPLESHWAVLSHYESNNPLFPLSSVFGHGFDYNCMSCCGCPWLSFWLAWKPVISSLWLNNGHHGAAITFL